ncbi:hypothetical protein ACG74X_20380 [Marivita sp. S0852]|uniref:hypothetical protein n=1 Tax=Marivita sp. S0852 TaxID=3373893 RepID=UPI003981D4A3
MPRIFLTDETYIVANDGALVFGSAGAEQVVFLDGVRGAALASTVDRIDLPGPIADFTCSSFGNSLTIRDGSGDIIAAISGADSKLIAQGQRVVVDGTAVETAEAQLAEIQKQYTVFQSERLPILKSLMVV